MKKLVMLKPTNIYLERVFFLPLMEYSKTTEHPIETIQGLAIKDSGVMIDSRCLSPALIMQLKNNGNTIYSFDINDNSVFDGTYRNSKEIHDIDLFFKVAGIQKTRESNELFMDNQMNCTKRLVPFCNQKDWKTYTTIRDAGKMHSLPYVLWKDADIQPVPYEKKKKLCLIRGGHHYYRFIQYLHLLKKKKVDALCGFQTSIYVAQMCRDCQKIWQDYGGISYARYGMIHTSCEIPKPLPSDFFNWQITGKANWNNGCTPRLYDMAEVFKKYQGDIDMGLLEQALNGAPVRDAEFYDLMKEYLLYGDYKWIFSIYAPPRFWEAASARTISYYPRRTNDQRYFPEMKDGEHYLTFSEDFSDLDNIDNITKEQFEYITNSCYELYQKWIKGGKYKLNENLMKYIFEKMGEV